MINKIEANAIVAKVEEKKKAEYKAKIEDFCNTVIDSEIKKAAEQGEKKVPIIKCQREMIEDIMEFVSKNGFSVYKIGIDNIFIQW